MWVTEIYILCPYLWGNQLKDSINLGEYSPELDNNGIYILPASGEYEIRVLQPRSQARKDKNLNTG